MSVNKMGGKCFIFPFLQDYFFFLLAWKDFNEILESKNSKCKTKRSSSCIPVNNSVRRDMKELRRASSKSRKQSLHCRENRSPVTAFTIY